MRCGKMLEFPDQHAIAQLGAKAIFELAPHGSDCTNPKIPTRVTTTVVRMTLESVLSRFGQVASC